MHRPLPIHAAASLAAPFRAAAGGIMLALLTGCQANPPADTAMPMVEPAAGPAAVDPVEAREAARVAAERERAAYAGLSFEEFEKLVYKEPFEGGKYLVNGDTPIADRKLLQEFFEQEIQNPVDGTPRLIVHQIGGLDAVWNSVAKRQLTYCVSTAFDERHADVVNAMAVATQAWESTADIRYAHVAAEDGACRASNPLVTFDVRPVDVGGRYLARAFFPNDSRNARNVLIDKSSFQLDPNGSLQLTGILRHELGHTLGFRHEHTRPQANACFEDANWRPLTDYDPLSVMHYPQCNGLGDWKLTLTTDDRKGAACLYGSPSGMPLDAKDCPTGAAQDDPPVAGEPITVTLADKTVKRNQEKIHGPYEVTPGTLFQAFMTPAKRASGDPDLYVRFSRPAERLAHDCRPFLTGALESCELDVPNDGVEAYVMVRGYRNGNYDLRIVHAPPAPLVAALAKAD